MDAGFGTASDAVLAMELGCDAVLVNSAIAEAKDPILMAESFKNAVIAGRQSYLAKRMKKKIMADASSPTKNLLTGVIMNIIKIKSSFKKIDPMDFLNLMTLR